VLVDLAGDGRHRSVIYLRHRVVEAFGDRRIVEAEIADAHRRSTHRLGDADMARSQTKVTSDAWVPDDAASVHEIVHRHGGKYLARSGNVTTIEGNPLDTSLIAIIAFPSAKHARDFVADPAYVPHLKARRHGSESRFQGGGSVCRAANRAARYATRSALAQVRNRSRYIGVIDELEYRSVSLLKSVAPALGQAPIGAQMTMGS
jgi:uncharacterized protein (DUF1330 family)